MGDIAIIGGGPAGLTAGLYAGRGGGDAVLYEELFVGGQAAKTEHIDNFPGFPEGLDGFSVGSLLEQQATRFHVQIEYESVQGLDLKGEEKVVSLDGRQERFKAVILCMGATPRKLDLPDEERLTGAGVSYCATCDGAFFRDKDVAVIGGGDTALADALYLSRFCSTVTVVHRRDQLRAAASLQKAAFEDPRIRFLWDSVPAALEGETSLTGLVTKNVKTGETERLPLSGLFVAVGIVPRTGLVAGQVDLTPGGQIVTDPFMRTNLAGVFAAGDVRNTPLRQVVTGCADGAIAATSALEYLYSK